jgi:hypothetical protein
MMKDVEPQIWQAKHFCTITWRRHCARSPEGYIPAEYTLLLYSRSREGCGAKFAEITFYEVGSIEKSVVFFEGFPCSAIVSIPRSPVLVAGAFSRSPDGRAHGA